MIPATSKLLPRRRLRSSGFVQIQRIGHRLPHPGIFRQWSKRTTQQQPKIGFPKSFRFQPCRQNLRPHPLPPMIDRRVGNRKLRRQLRPSGENHRPELRTDCRPHAVGEEVFMKAALRRQNAAPEIADGDAVFIASAGNELPPIFAHDLGIQRHAVFAQSRQPDQLEFQIVIGHIGNDHPVRRQFERHCRNAFIRHSNQPAKTFAEPARGHAIGISRYRRRHDHAVIFHQHRDFLSQ
ncbi:hypothetical protein SDC9_106978 [bioreactor metagenome]|uniref:Uncharacterized protein n=1 Tax=bioreactor metagenome TaxID=1076179 RepID=A0A645B688_9ZZZZ